MTERLYQNYKNDIVTVLQNKFNYKNVMEIPKIDKVVVNMGVGEAVKDSKKIEIAQKELASITGQFPIITKAKKANASFKLREGMSVGLKVTLRKSKMYEFIDRLINIALPRVRDFRGISDKSLSIEERFNAQLKLSECPRNGAKIRLRNRCEVTGRPRGFYRKFKMSRIALREHALAGLIPGMVKSSW